MNEKTYEHESYGMISVSRVSSNKGQVLFGSSIDHRNYIKLEISTASCDRHLDRDWFHSRKHLITVMLSHSQFVEMIGNMNTTGVPTTIEYYNGKQMSDPPTISKRQQFEQEFEDHLKEINDDADKLMKRMDELLNKPTLNKGDRDELKELSRKIQQDIKSNTPFIQKSFNEQMDNTIKEAKGEVESFINNKIVTLGLKELKNDFNLLEDKSE